MTFHLPRCLPQSATAAIGRNRPKVPFRDRFAAAFHARQKQNRLLDVRCQIQQVHGLRGGTILGYRSCQPSAVEVGVQRGILAIGGTIEQA